MCLNATLKVNNPKGILVESEMIPKLQPCQSGTMVAIFCPNDCESEVSPNSAHAEVTGCHSWQDVSTRGGFLT